MVRGIVTNVGKANENNKLFTNRDYKDVIFLKNIHTLDGKKAEYTMLTGDDIGRALIMTSDSMVPWYGTVKITED